MRKGTTVVNKDGTRTAGRWVRDEHGRQQLETVDEKKPEPKRKAAAKAKE